MNIFRTTAIYRRFWSLALVLLIVTPLSQATDQAVPNGFVGIVTKSDSQKPGAQLTFANLSLSKPFVTWPSGHGVETTKVFDDNEITVLLLVSITGSTETFYLNKITKRFSIVQVNASAATAKGIEDRPQISYGNLK